ncbi:hypothetical protein SAMN05661080_05100 [Modestobacter sp. DSM 44400]|nr:hypothetical protein SAMN05661080_05100 [Modestobacter sp. DSM 44400]
MPRLGRQTLGLSKSDRRRYQPKTFDRRRNDEGIEGTALDECGHQIVVVRRVVEPLRCRPLLVQVDQQDSVAPKGG